MSAELDRLSELEAKATPGPWKSLVNRAGYSFVARGQADHITVGPHDIPDAALIAAARNALPALIEVARAAEEWAWVPVDERCVGLEQPCGVCPRCVLRSALASLVPEAPSE